MLFSSAHNTTLWWKKWPLRTGGEPVWIKKLIEIESCSVPGRPPQISHQNRCLISILFVSPLLLHSSLVIYHFIQLFTNSGKFMSRLNHKHHTNLLNQFPQLIPFWWVRFHFLDPFGNFHQPTCDPNVWLIMVIKPALRKNRSFLFTYLPNLPPFLSTFTIFLHHVISILNI